MSTAEEAALLISDAKRRLSSASGVDATLSMACMELGGDLRELHRQFAAEIDPAAVFSPGTRGWWSF